MFKKILQTIITDEVKDLWKEIRLAIIMFISSHYTDYPVLKYILPIICALLLLRGIASMFRRYKTEIKEEVGKMINMNKKIDGKIEIRNAELCIKGCRIYLKFQIVNLSTTESIGCYVRSIFYIDELPRKSFKSEAINLLPTESRDFNTETSPLNAQNEAYFVLAIGDNEQHIRNIECEICLQYGIPSCTFDMEKSFHFFYTLKYEYENKQYYVLKTQPVSKED